MQCSHCCLGRCAKCPLFVRLAYQCCCCYSSLLFVCFVVLYAGHPYIHLISFEIFLLACGYNHCRKSTVIRELQYFRKFSPQCMATSNQIAGIERQTLFAILDVLVCWIPIVFVLIVNFSVLVACLIRLHCLPFAFCCSWTIGCTMCCSIFGRLKNMLIG